MKKGRGRSREERKPERTRHKESKTQRQGEPTEMILAETERGVQNSR